MRKNSSIWLHVMQYLNIFSFSLRDIDGWNALPANVILAPSINSFKSHISKHWHGHPVKFEAERYQPADQQTIGKLRRNSFPWANEWSIKILNYSKTTER